MRAADGIVVGHLVAPKGRILARRERHLGLSVPGCRVRRAGPLEMRCNRIRNVGQARGRNEAHSEVKYRAGCPLNGTLAPKMQDRGSRFDRALVRRGVEQGLRWRGACVVTEKLQAWTCVI